MPNVTGLVASAAEHCGFRRERYNDRNLPTDPSKITVVPFFGDLRSLFVVSSLLLRRFWEEKAGRYLIFCSWPGFQSLFPYVDEYWEVASDVANLYAGASGFGNKNSGVYHRNLNHYFFEDVVHDAFSVYCNQGLTGEFWSKPAKRYLPSVAATKSDCKILVYPSLFFTHWNMGATEQIPVPKSFWESVLDRLIQEKFTPLVYKSVLTHDIPGIADGLLSAMRAVGCVLDVFSGVSRLALAARCPFVAVDERERYATLKEYEIDDLCGVGVPRQYIFSLPTIIGGSFLVDGIMAKLHSFLPGLDRDEWPDTGETYESISYDTVRKKTTKRLGTRLIKAK